jgi:hypothetical protein
MLSQKQNKGWQSGSSGKAPASKPKALNSIPSISHTHKTNKQMNKKKKSKTPKGRECFVLLLLLLLLIFLRILLSGTFKKPVEMKLFSSQVP